MTETEIKRGPGRPPRKQVEKKKRRRRDDMSLSRHDRLAVPENAKDPNYQYRWVNDSPGRIHALTQMDDYDVVTEEELSGQEYDGEGTPVRRALGFGPGGDEYHAYLCKKPREYYEADKAKEQEAIAEVEKAAEQGVAPGEDGLTSADHAYVPRGHQNRLG